MTALALGCGIEVVGLLARRQLHLGRANVGAWAELPDSRRYQVFRESWAGAGDLDDTVTLAVWFHLRGMPPGAGVRRWLFERESILNTLLFAGFEGYRLKLWMVDPRTCDYAGLYAWHDVEAAGRYACYITALLRPLSVRGSVGYEVVERPLDAHLAATHSQVHPGPTGPGRPSRAGR